MIRLTGLLCGLSLALLMHAPNLAAQADGDTNANDNPVVTLRTSKGNIRIELYPQQAPATVENFLRYARDGFYDGTIFHRVISHFMIQGGGMTPDMKPKETREPIPNEAANDLKNLRGMVAMARTSDPHSASSQFFINVEANPVLDHTAPTDSRSWGYTVFGRVVEGMDVVDDIRFVETNTVNGMNDVPVEPVIIQSAEVD